MLINRQMGYPQHSGEGLSIPPTASHIPVRPPPPPRLLSSQHPAYPPPHRLALSQQPAYPPPPAYLLSRHSNFSFDEKDGKKKKEKKGLSMFIRPKDKPRITTMSPPGTNKVTPQYIFQRPQTSYMPNAYLQPTHTRLDNVACPPVTPPAVQETLPALEKLDLPFVEGCNHIGSRFSVNTLFAEVAKKLPKNPEGEFVCRYQQDFATNPLFKNRTRGSMYGADEQKPSVLGRTRQAYGLKARKSPRDGIEDDSDDRSNAEGRLMGYCEASSSESSDISGAGFRLGLNHSSSNLLHTAVAEEHEPEEPDAPFENWVATALQSPVTFDKRLSLVNSSGTGSSQVPTQTNPRAHSLETIDECREEQLMKPAQQQCTPVKLLTPTAPLNIRKSSIKSATTLSPSNESSFRPGPNATMGTSQVIADIRAPPERAPAQPPILIAQPWGRVRQNMGVRSRTQIQALPLARPPPGRTLSVNPQRGTSRMTLAKPNSVLMAQPSMKPKSILLPSSRYPPAQPMNKTLSMAPIVRY